MNYQVMQSHLIVGWWVSKLEKLRSWDCDNHHMPEDYPRLMLGWDGVDVVDSTDCHIVWFDSLYQLERRC
jgi:hypothetical protein